MCLDDLLYIFIKTCWKCCFLCVFGSCSRCSTPPLCLCRFHIHQRKTHEFSEKHGFYHWYMEDIYSFICCLKCAFIVQSVCKYLPGNPLSEATLYGISSFPNHSPYLVYIDSNGCFLFPAGKFFGTQKRESSLLCHSTVLVCWTPKKRWPMTVSAQILDLKYITVYTTVIINNTMGLLFLC